MDLNQFSTVDIVLDKANDNIIQRQTISAGDRDGRSLTLQVTNEGSIGEVTGLTANLLWTNHSSGLSDLSAFSVVDRLTSVFKIEYPQNMLTAGKVTAQIQLLHNGKATHSKKFEIIVLDVAGKLKGVLQSAEYTALVEALAKANGFEGDIRNLDIKKAEKSDVADVARLKADRTYVDAMLSSIASGGPKELFYSLDALKAKYPNGGQGTYLVFSSSHQDGAHIYIWQLDSWKDLGVYQAESVADEAIGFAKISDKLMQTMSDNLLSTNKSNWFQGSLTSGVDVEGIWRVRSSFIKVDNEQTYLLSINDSDYSLFIAMYDSNKVFLRNYQNARYINSDNVMHFESDVSYIKVVLARTSKPILTIAEAIDNLPIKIAVIDAINFLNDDKKYVLKKLDTDNVIPSSWQAGTLSSSGIFGPANTRLVSDYVPVLPNSKYFFKYPADNKYQIYTCNYNDKKEFLLATPYDSVFFETSRTTSFVRFVIKNKNGDYEPIRKPEILITTTRQDLYKITTGIFTRAIWSQGSLDNDGLETVTDKRLRTDFIKTLMTSYRVYFADVKYKIAIVFYDKDKKFVASTGYINPLNADFYFNGAQGEYFRIVLNQNTTSEDVTLPLTVISDAKITIFEDIPTDYNKAYKIRVASHNLGHFNYGVGEGYSGVDVNDKINDWIKLYSGLNADIIGIQEFYLYFDKNKTQRADKLIYNHFYPHVNNGFTDTAFATKSRLQNITCGFLKGAGDRTTNRGYIKGYLDFDSTLVCFINVHLSPNDPAQRLIQTQELITLLANETHFVLTGDFNANDASAYDLFRDAGFRMANTSVFGNYDTYIHDIFPLDNIITSSNILIDNVIMLNNTATSDHRMLVSDLSILI